MLRRSPEDKIMDLAQALAWRRELAARGTRLAITNGCFDLLHRGHAQYLAGAAACTDALLVAVNSDRSVQALKGPDRPVVGEKDRAYLVASLECVDAVVLFETVKPIPVFRALTPDIYVKGGDYTVRTLDAEERVILQEMGCEFVFIPFVEGHSTTETIRRVRREKG
jgi:rfaE bifunctional protein nucleotidyltransferase chain/domain